MSTLGSKKRLVINHIEKTVRIHSLFKKAKITWRESIGLEYLNLANEEWTKTMEQAKYAFGYSLNDKGIPDNFTLAETLGTVGGDLYVDKEFVKPTTTKGYISEAELHRGFEEAERFFSQNPTVNEHVYDSLKFHTYDHSPYLIYCLPFGVVYYKELDHE